MPDYGKDKFLANGGKTVIVNFCMADKPELAVWDRFLNKACIVLSRGCAKHPLSIETLDCPLKSNVSAPKNLNLLSTGEDESYFISAIDGKSYFSSTLSGCSSSSSSRETSPDDDLVPSEEDDSDDLDVDIFAEEAPNKHQGTQTVPVLARSTLAYASNWTHLRNLAAEFFQVLDNSDRCSPSLLFS